MKYDTLFYQVDLLIPEKSQGLSNPEFLFVDYEMNGKPLDLDSTKFDLNNWPKILYIYWIVCDADGFEISSKEFYVKTCDEVDKTIENHMGITKTVCNERGENPEIVFELLKSDLLNVKRVISGMLPIDYYVINCEFLRNDRNILVTERKFYGIDQFCMWKFHPNDDYIPPRVFKKTIERLYPEIKLSHDQLYHSKMYVLLMRKCFYDNLGERRIVRQERVENNKIDKFLVFDVETANSNRNSICQIGYVIIENGEIIKEESINVKPPGNEYFYKNMQIHHITPDTTKNEKTFDLIWDSIKNDFDRNILVAHNASFDTDVLYKTLKHYNIKHDQFQYLCTYALSNLKLIELCESYDVELSDHHNALADAKACAECFIKIQQGIKPKVITVKEKATKNSIYKNKQLKGEVLKMNSDKSVKTNRLYGKKVVFTGDLLSMTRMQAAELANLQGADVNTSISTKTNIVVVGSNPGPEKIKKIDVLNSSGCNICLINESDFIQMVTD